MFKGMFLILKYVNIHSKPIDTNTVFDSTCSHAQECNVEHLNTYHREQVICVFREQRRETPHTDKGVF